MCFMPFGIFHIIQLRGGRLQEMKSLADGKSSKRTQNFLTAQIIIKDKRRQFFFGLYLCLLTAMLQPHSEYCEYQQQNYVSLSSYSLEFRSMDYAVNLNANSRAYFVRHAVPIVFSVKMLFCFSLSVWLPFLPSDLSGTIFGVAPKQYSRSQFA